MTLKQRKQEGMALISIVFIFLAEIWGIKRFMTFFIVDVFLLLAIFKWLGAKTCQLQTNLIT
jgi:hypothetical protein